MGAEAKLAIQCTADMVSISGEVIAPSNLRGYTMKKLILAATAIVSAVALTTTAKAADIAPAAYDWTGFYFGVNAGVAWNNTEIDNDVELYRYRQDRRYITEQINDVLNDIEETV